MDSGVAQKPILNMDAYAQELSARRDPIASTAAASLTSASAAIRAA